MAYNTGMNQNEKVWRIVKNGVYVGTYKSLDEAVAEYEKIGGDKIVSVDKASSDDILA